MAGAVANAALALDRRVAVNLNYTASSEVMNACIARARIRRVLTSRKVVERFPNLRLDAELVFLEDVVPRLTRRDKLVAALQARLVPVFLLERLLGLSRVDPEEVATIIFTSGSTGDPKGVMLTHRNIATNVDAFGDALRFYAGDVLVGVLPFFHSFGYTVTVWAALMLDPKVVYHHNPLEYRQVAALAAKHRANILVATPTFLRTYLRGCDPADFAALDLVVTGAEKLPTELADAFQKRFGVRPVEGYGTTELSPVVSCNIPPARMPDRSDAALREGTVGRPMRDIEVKVVDLDSGQELGLNRSGMLLVRGPNVMKGYLDEPRKTAEVMRDGWYVTGDIAQIEPGGFIRITGRESRFAKIGGEMVPHIRIEEALTRILNLEEDSVALAVTSVPDARKGERLVVLHTGLPKPVEQVCRELNASGLPPLWIPSPDSFCQVAEIPVLGTGKVDLRRLRDLALKQSESR